MHRVLHPFGFILLLVMLMPMPTRAQPWKSGTPTGTVISPLAHRHPNMPSLDSLFQVAPDARQAVYPANGGINDDGRPVWTHQVRRMCLGDSTMPFTGWTRQILVDSDHRWRFQRFKKGWLVEQVGYYETGMADHHFHTDTTGNNVGSQRMWYPDGRVYLDQFHDDKGELHGRQLRWNSEGKLEWDAQFDHGHEIDAEGRIISNSESRPPSKGGC